MNFSECWMFEGDVIYNKSMGYAQLFLDPISKHFNMSGLELEQFVLGMSGKANIPPLMSVNKGIAQINIGGALAPGSHAMMSMVGGTSTTEIKKAFEQVARDPKIKGVFMKVDSPGGNSAGIDETAALIRQVSARKPVVSHVVGANGSAAYYLTSGSNKIFAENRTNRIGSIGTKLVLRDDSEALEKIGVKTVVVDTGVNKSVGQSGVSITEDHKAYLGDFVNKLQGFFEESVKEGRPQIDINAVNDGSMFLAKQAQAKGLIDGIQPARNSMAVLQAMSS